MTGAAREKDQADFDLERVIDMFDEAMTSRDPRVINALRSLMMIVTLTRSETYNNPIEDKNRGPLRRLFEDMHHINRRLSDVEHNVRRMERVNVRAEGFEKEREWPDQVDKYTFAAGRQVAQQIDQDVLNRITGIPSKGLLKK